MQELSVYENDIKREFFNVVLCAIIVVFLIAFAPVLAFIASIAGLILIGNFKCNHLRAYYIIFAASGFISTLISATSHPIFLYSEADYTTYYYNYQLFLDSGFDTKFFFFAGGVEVGVPLLNYIFSIIINHPMPFMVKLCHALVQTSLLYFCVQKISKYHKLSLKSTAFLLALMLLFFKYGSTLNHLRQGYSSFFIILAFYSQRRRWLFILLAASFHLSAIVIYPLVKFLLFSRDLKKLKRFSIYMLLCGGSIYITLEVVSNFILNSNFKLLGKLVWAFRHSIEGDAAADSFKGTLFASIYFFPLLLIGFYSVLFYKKSQPFNYNLIAIVSFLISFSFLPGLSIRVLSSLLLIMMGYFYFLYFHFLINFKQSLTFSFAFLFFFTVNWVGFTPLYFYSYPMFDYKPFYYIPTFMVEKKAIRRYVLPSQLDITIENPNKL